MQTKCLCVLFLAVTSSSLGTPLSKRELVQHKKEGKPDVDRVEHRSGNTPLIMVRGERMGIQILSEKQNVAPPAPKSFDWRSKSVISPVLNEGNLVDSLAIAAAECVESLRAISKGSLVPLSFAEVQDCCPDPTEDMFQCIHNIGGICSTSVYPVLTGHCRNRSCDSQWEIKGGKAVPANNVMAMTEALLVNPLLVMVDATRPSFEMYTSGIYSDPDCNKLPVNHAMVVVGYGEEDGKGYWICKNSWGTNWGEKGYIRVLKGMNTCGIESFASYPLNMS